MEVRGIQKTASPAQQEENECQGKESKAHQRVFPCRSQAFGPRIKSVFRDRISRSAFTQVEHHFMFFVLHQKDTMLQNIENSRELYFIFTNALLK